MKVFDLDIEHPNLEFVHITVSSNIPIDEDLIERRFVFHDTKTLPLYEVYDFRYNDMNADLVEAIQKVCAEGKYHTAARVFKQHGFIRFFRNADFPCTEHPELQLFSPIGMYHCPVCGEMVVAGFNHPTIGMGDFQQVANARQMEFIAILRDLFPRHLSPVLHVVISEEPEGKDVVTITINGAAFDSKNPVTTIVVRDIDFMSLSEINDATDIIGHSALAFIHNGIRNRMLK